MEPGAEPALAGWLGPCSGGKHLFVLAKPAGQGSGLCQAAALVSSCSSIPAPGDFAPFSEACSLLQGMARANKLLLLPSSGSQRASRLCPWLPGTFPTLWLLPLGQSYLGLNPSLFWGFSGFCCPLTSLAAQLPSSPRQNLRWFLQKADFLLASSTGENKK